MISRHTRSFITPHAQREWGKVIGVGVHTYIYIGMFVDKKIFESYFSNRLTFSNICGRTSRLALPLLSPETLSSSIFSYIMPLLHKRIGKYRHLVNWN